MYRVKLGVWGFEVWRDDEFIYTFRTPESAERFVKSQNRIFNGEAVAPLMTKK